MGNALLVAGMWDTMSLKWDLARLWTYGRGGSDSHRGLRVLFLISVS